MEFLAKWGGPYHEASRAVDKCNSKGIPAKFGIDADCKTDILTASQFGKVIAILVFSGIKPWEWAMKMRENDTEDWRKV